ncbi:helix-turn-helix domain-containing protein [Roseateles sp. BYS87W]|uniref:Helix-turn-helix domain-containing protein n=1 Tax=Pelomonas baiyunensis TaxID=3299026 RepID=A0ABW7H2L1_9BURK
MEQPTPDSAADRLSLDTLASLTGVSPRTIRFYIAQGLLDRPEGEKRGAHYLQRHLDQLLQIRRFSEAGHSLDRIRALMQGAPEDPPRQRTEPGAVEVWSRMTLVDGLELHVEPGRAGLSPEQLRALLQGLTQLYHQVRAR